VEASITGMIKHIKIKNQLVYKTKGHPSKVMDAYL